MRIKTNSKNLISLKLKKYAPALPQELMTALHELLAEHRQSQTKPAIQQMIIYIDIKTFRECQTKFQGMLTSRPFLGTRKWKLAYEGSN